jgi:hypothetical protein
MASTDIKFEWVPPRFGPLDNSLKEPIEERIKAYVQESDDFRPCHQGQAAVFFESTDPLVTVIRGTIKCSCGKVIFRFEASTVSPSVEFFPT